MCQHDDVTTMTNLMVGLSVASVSVVTCDELSSPSLRSSPSSWKMLMICGRGRTSDSDIDIDIDVDVSTAAVGCDA